MEPVIKVGPKSEPEPEPQLCRISLRSYICLRPSLLIAKEPVTTTKLRKRAVTGVLTNEQVGELSLVPVRPVKKTRSGCTVKATEKVMGAV